MPFRLAAFRRRVPQLIAAVAVDGDTARYVLVNGPEEPERGKLREARSWPAPESAYWVGQDLETYAESERAEAKGIAAVTGDDVQQLLVTVRPDFADASEAQRQAYAIASTPWGNEDTLQKVGLTVSMMAVAPGSDTYVVAAAETREVEAARERMPLDPSNVSVTTMGPALEALFRATHAGELDRLAPLLVVLANDTYVSSVVLERGVPRAYAHATFADLIDEVIPRGIPNATASRLATEDRDAVDADETESASSPVSDNEEAKTLPANAPEGFVAGGYEASAYKASPSSRSEASNGERRTAAHDLETTQAAYRLALRRALELFTSLASDAGVEAFATDIDLVYVTGAGVFSYGALECTADYFAEQATVRPLAAHRVTFVFDDPLLAANLGDNEAAFADTLALVALARRPDMLSLEPYAHPTWAGAPARATHRPEVAAESGRTRALVVAIVVMLLILVPTLGLRHYFITSESARLRRELATATAEAEKLSDELERRKRDAARIADNEANNKVVADAEGRNAFHAAFLDAVRTVFANVNAEGDEARIDGMQCDTGDGFNVTGSVANTAAANHLVNGLASHGSGRFHDLDLRTETFVSKEPLPTEADPEKTEERPVERLRFTIRGHFSL